jgi:hypothetical protein
VKPDRNQIALLWRASSEYRRSVVTTTCSPAKNRSMTVFGLAEWVRHQPRHDKIRARTIPAFESDPSLGTGDGLMLRLQVLPAPDIPETTSKPKGAPRKCQDGVFPCPATAAGQDGIPLGFLSGGGGIIAARFAAGIWIYRKPARRDPRGRCFTAQNR